MEGLLSLKKLTAEQFLHQIAKIYKNYQGERYHDGKN